MYCCVFSQFPDEFFSYDDGVCTYLKDTCEVDDDCFKDHYCNENGTCEWCPYCSDDLPNTRCPSCQSNPPCDVVLFGRNGTHSEVNDIYEIITTTEIYESDSYSYDILYVNLGGFIFLQGIYEPFFHQSRELTQWLIIVYGLSPELHFHGFGLWPHVVPFWVEIDPLTYEFVDFDQAMTGRCVDDEIFDVIDAECLDYPPDWQDSDGQNCSEQEEIGFCITESDSDISSVEACCSCGGGRIDAPCSFEMSGRAGNFSFVNGLYYEIPSDSENIQPTFSDEWGIVNFKPKDDGWLIELYDWTDIAEGGPGALPHDVAVWKFFSDEHSFHPQSVEDANVTLTPCFYWEPASCEMPIDVGGVEVTSLDCSVENEFFGDGFCDSVLNDEKCLWDGGDCCEDTCVSGTTVCGYNGFDCKDPASGNFGHSAEIGTKWLLNEYGVLKSRVFPAIYILNVPIENDFEHGSFLVITSDAKECLRISVRLNDETLIEIDDSALHVQIFENGMYKVIISELMDGFTGFSLTIDLYPPSCIPESDYVYRFLGDGMCDNYDYDLNIEDCKYDGGDCCWSTCDSVTTSCGFTETLRCKDPDSLPSEYDGSSAHLESGNSYLLKSRIYPDAMRCHVILEEGDHFVMVNDKSESLFASVYSDDGLYFYDGEVIDFQAQTDGEHDLSFWINRELEVQIQVNPDCSNAGDGFCDSEQNNVFCRWDGGDCCEATCISGAYTCGTGGYNCEDKNIVSDCVNFVDWVDSTNDDCFDYNSNELWCEIAASFENNGFDATDACCICGGGNIGQDITVISEISCDDSISATLEGATYNEKFDSEVVLYKLEVPEQLECLHVSMTSQVQNFLPGAEIFTDQNLANPICQLSHELNINCQITSNETYYIAVYDDSIVNPTSRNFVLDVQCISFCGVEMSEDECPGVELDLSPMPADSKYIEVNHIIEISVFDDDIDVIGVCMSKDAHTCGETCGFNETRKIFYSAPVSGDYDIYTNVLQDDSDENVLNSSVIGYTLVPHIHSLDFGVDVSIDGNWAFVSDPYAKSNGLSESGLVYVYQSREGSFAWDETAIIRPLTEHVGMEFGASIDVHKNTLVVGTGEVVSNAAYVFERRDDDSAVWVQTQVLQLEIGVVDATSPIFGSVIGIHDNWIVGKANILGEELCIFEKTEREGWRFKSCVVTEYEGSWDLPRFDVSKNVIASGRFFESTASTDARGVISIIEFLDDDWQLTQEIQIPFGDAFFGWLSVAVSDSLLVVGAITIQTLESVTGGVVLLYERKDEGEWKFTETLTSPYSQELAFGRTVELENDILAVRGSSIIYLYKNREIGNAQVDKSNNKKKTDYNFELIHILKEPCCTSKSSTFGSVMGLSDGTLITGSSGNENGAHIFKDLYKASEKVLTVEPEVIKETLPPETTPWYLTFSMIVMYVVALIMVVFFIFFAIAMLRNKDGVNTKLLTVGGAIGDLLTDVAFIYEVWTVGLFVIAYVSIASLGLALVVNLALVIVVVRRELRQKEFRAWFDDNGFAASFVIALSCTNITALPLIYSNVFLFNKTSFAAPVTKQTEQSTHYGLASALCEDLPQFVLQLVVISTKSMVTPVVFISLFFSFCGLATKIVEYSILFFSHVCSSKTTPTQVHGPPVVPTLDAGNTKLPTDILNELENQSQSSEKKIESQTEMTDIGTVVLGETMLFKSPNKVENLENNTKNAQGDDTRSLSSLGENFNEEPEM